MKLRFFRESRWTVRVDLMSEARPNVVNLSIGIINFGDKVFSPNANAINTIPFEALVEISDYIKNMEHIS